MSNILIIEDEALAAMALTWIIKDMGHTVIGAVGTGIEAEILAAASAPELILSDVSIRGDRDGIEVVSALVAKQAAKVVFLTGNTDTETKRRAAIVSNNRILAKPYSADDVKNAVAHALAA